MLTHLDSQGRANMVDVTEKAVTEREATAEARVRMLPQTLQMIVDGGGTQFDQLVVEALAASERPIDQIRIRETDPEIMPAQAA